MIYVFFALLLTPVIEIAVFIQVGGLIGLWPTLVTVVVTAVFGAYLLRQQGLATLQSAQATMAEGQMPMAQVFDGLCLLVAGIVLLTPGFVTDAIGFALFIKPLRKLLADFMVRRLTASPNFSMSSNFSVQGNNFGNDYTQPTYRADDQVIDGKSIDLSDTDEGPGNENSHANENSPWNKD
jgi:UPF0716 protein FxsA